MTPKDKAKQLFEKIYFEIQSDELGKCYQSAKQCTLIAVEQLIEYQDEFTDYVRMDLPSNVVAGLPYKYWDKVKKEIELL